MKKRNYTRVECSKPCLVKYNNSIHKANIENFSIGGALFKVVEDAFADFCVGDFCNIIFDSFDEILPVEYRCEIIRKQDSHIGMNFQRIEVYC